MANYMPLIKNVEIPRCYSSILSEADKVELHNFVDAGEYAYAAVCYVLAEHKGITTITLVAAKLKVEPLKPMSTPRMELQATLVGVRLANKIKKIRRLHITSCYWWSDSKTDQEIYNNLLCTE